MSDDVALAIKELRRRNWVGISSQSDEELGSVAAAFFESFGAYYAGGKPENCRELASIVGDASLSKWVSSSEDKPQALAAFFAVLRGHVENIIEKGEMSVLHLIVSGTSALRSVPKDKFELVAEFMQLPSVAENGGSTADGIKKLFGGGDAYRSSEEAWKTFEPKIQKTIQAKRPVKAKLVEDEVWEFRFQPKLTVHGDWFEAQ